MKASVIIPAYNAAQFLADTLQSVISQSFDDYEIIVVDDGSTDQTRTVVERFPNVRYHYQSNLGPAAARNAGLRMAQGQYLAFLDADDLWKPEMLQVCISILEEHPEIGAVQVKWLPIDGSGKLISSDSSWQPWRGDVRERLLIDIPFNTSSIVWRRHYWDQIGGYDETPETNDDWINWMRIVYKGCQFECIAEPLVLRRRHAAALTQQQTRRIVMWRFRALETLCQELALPEALCRRAYARLHWVATVAELQAGDHAAAQSSFIKAVLDEPTILQNKSTFFALLYYGHNQDELTEHFDPEHSWNTLNSCLKQLFGEASLPADLTCRQAEIWGTAIFYLAQACYAERQSEAARRFAFKSIQRYPGILVSRDAVQWFLRFLLGPTLIQRLRWNR